MAISIQQIRDQLNRQLTRQIDDVCKKAVYDQIDPTAMEHVMRDEERNRYLRGLENSHRSYNENINAAQNSFITDNTNPYQQAIADGYNNWGLSKAARQAATQAPPRISHEEVVQRKIAALNSAPETSVSLSTAFTLFAARWGMGWVYLDTRRPEDRDEMDWLRLANRLYNADMMERNDDGIYRLIERENGNN